MMLLLLEFNLKIIHDPAEDEVGIMLEVAEVSNGCKWVVAREGPGFYL